MSKTSVPKEDWPSFPDERKMDNLTLNPATVEEQLDADWSTLQATAEEPVKQLQRMSKAELKKFVLDSLAGDIFTSAQMRDTNLMTLVFLPLGLGALHNFEPEALKDVGIVWAYMNETFGNRSINGYPFFKACRFMHKDDWAKASAALAREQARLEEIEV